MVLRSMLELMLDLTKLWLLTRRSTYIECGNTVTICAHAIAYVGTWIRIAYFSNDGLDRMSSISLSGERSRFSMAWWSWHSDAFNTVKSLMRFIRFKSGTYFLSNCFISKRPNSSTKLSLFILSIQDWKERANIRSDLRYPAECCRNLSVTRWSHFVRHQTANLKSIITVPYGRYYPKFCFN